MGWLPSVVAENGLPARLPKRARSEAFPRQRYAANRIASVRPLRHQPLRCAKARKLRRLVA